MFLIVTREKLKIFNEVRYFYNFEFDGTIELFQFFVSIPPILIYIYICF